MPPLVIIAKSLQEMQTFAEYYSGDGELHRRIKDFIYRRNRPGDEITDARYIEMKPIRKFEQCSEDYPQGQFDEQVLRITE